jgi:N-acetylneuraminic acid mutarotase
MPDLESRVRDSLRAAAVRTPVPDRLEERARGLVRRRARRRLVTAVASAVIVCLGVGVAAPIYLDARDGEMGSGVLSGGPAWRTFPKPPIEGQWGAKPVWTGKQLLLLSPWIAGPPFGGVALDPATERWRQLPHAPVEPAGTQPDYPYGTTQLQVWTGKELVVVLDHMTVSYNPATNRWRQGPPPPFVPLSMPPPAAFWTGKEVLFWDGGPLRKGAADSGGRGAAYNPTTRRWRELPAAPLRNRGGAHTAWTGKVLLVIGGSGTRQDETFRDGAAYEPAKDSWTALPAPPAGVALPTGDGAAAVWTGDELLLWNGSGVNAGQAAGGAVYNPASGTWRQLPAAPGLPRLGAATVWTGEELLAFGGIDPEQTAGIGRGGVAYRPATGTWRQVPGAAGKPRSMMSMVWTGSEALLVHPPDAEKEGGKEGGRLEGEVLGYTPSLDPAAG